MSRLTKFTHSCVRIDDGDGSLVIDPGIFSEAATALDGAQAVLITHEHVDHVDADAVRGAAKADPRLMIWAPASVASALGDLGEQVVTVGPGQRFEAAGFVVETFGGQHAVIHPSIPVVPNVGFLIEDSIYHPGDSLIVPTRQVSVLLVPLHAPWSRVAEVIDFAVSVRAPRAYPIHEALLHERAFPIVEGHLQRIGAEHGVEYTHLAAGSTIDV